MADHRYLIVGGGMTAPAAGRGIRAHDTHGPREPDPAGWMGLGGWEPFGPYKRPPLTKSLWKGDDESSVHLGTADLGVDVLTERRIVSLDLDARTATDDAGAAHGYERLLLATGGRPRTVVDWGDGVVYFRTLA